MGNCLGGIMSNVIYFSEKFAMFLSFTCLISCSIICMICMLAFGIGLGYNYSYVDTKTRHLPGLIRRPALQTTLALVTTNQLPGTLDIRMSLNVGGIVTESGPKVRYKSLKFSKSYTNRQMTYHIGPQLKSFRLM
ncbi:uncharacterized protein isoform X2 [Choristoneura fumiferana]|uniref:uncharacterized protein isoform X2 n=1 Tax=Choristoneura fumiferana TaxID=7141 RepID=UPI003D157A93